MKKKHLKNEEYKNNKKYIFLWSIWKNIGNKSKTSHLEFTAREGKFIDFRVNSDFTERENIFDDTNF